MPKYILHGGKEEYPSPMNDRFYKRLAEETPEGGVCLTCYFALDEGDSMENFEHDSLRILHAAKKLGKNIACKRAAIETFRADAQNADVIYFFGGDSTRQMANSKQFADVLKMDKVFAGSSSGAYLMGQKFRTTRTEDVLEGTGVLPFNLLAHADNPQYAPFKESLLAVSNSETPLICVDEGQFVTVEF